MAGDVSKYEEAFKAAEKVMGLTRMNCNKLLKQMSMEELRDLMVIFNNKSNHECKLLCIANYTAEVKVMQEVVDKLEHAIKTMRTCVAENFQEAGTLKDVFKMDFLKNMVQKIIDANNENAEDGGGDDME